MSDVTTKPKRTRTKDTPEIAREKAAIRAARRKLAEWKARKAQVFSRSKPKRQATEEQRKAVGNIANSTSETTLWKTRQAQQPQKGDAE